MIIIFLLAIATSYTSLLFGHSPVLVSNYGFCFSSTSWWIGNPLLSWGVNLAVVLGIGILLIIMNKEFTFIREITVLFSSFFFLIIATDPALSTRFIDGSLYCLVVLLCTIMLYSIYENPMGRRRIYLIFTILSLCSMFQYAFLFLMPIFFIGLIQVRAFSLPGLIAVILGIITPFWILLGLGLVSINDFMLPSIVNVFKEVDWSKIPILLATNILTVVIGIVMLVANMVKILNYSLQTRVYNGFIVILLLFSIIMMICDYKNILAYITLSACCVSIQVAHFYALSSFKKRYIVLFVIIALYLGLYIWQMVRL